MSVAIEEPAARDAAGAAVDLRPLLREIGDLKRITSAGRPGSIASRLFAEAWSRLVAGDPVRTVALGTTADALAAARLGDLDRASLATLGLPDAEASAIRREAVSQVTDGIAPALRDALLAAVVAPPGGRAGSAPPFVAALADQPRAGVTCPGRPRIVLLPAESHAEHCLAVAVYGVLLSPRYGADPATVFLAALAHHLHNVTMPDSGFTGEMLLGDHLGPVMQRSTDDALAQLAPVLRAAVIDARRILPDDATAEGRAFHAADVIDRVLEIDQHLRSARLTMNDVLFDMELVHDGPVKAFHELVLAEYRIP